MRQIAVLAEFERKIQRLDSSIVELEAALDQQADDLLPAVMRCGAAQFTLAAMHYALIAQS
jgi:hypothetical protein